MTHKSTFIMMVLAASTLWGLWLAFVGDSGSVHWVFWGSAQILPVAYIALALWGSEGHSEEILDLSDRPEFESTFQPERDRLV